MAKAEEPKNEPAKTDSAKLAVGDWQDRKRPARRTFPGPRGADAPLRIALEREAYADLIAHTKESLNVEVCGALVGQVCEDDAGLFVHVEALVRGTAARESGAHVTFTQETWNTIHQTIEHRYPKLQIVGWYHSHPGFGVEFSAMDVFIQKNFFPAPTQFALVTDPLGGDAAICVSTTEGIRYVPRFWVDGRELQCRIPQTAASGAGTAAGHAGDVAASLQALEARLSQLIQTVDEQRTLFNRFLMAVLMVVCVGVITWAGYGIYSHLTSARKPPELNSYVPVPVQIGDKTVLLGVGVAEWQVPPELNAVFLQLEKEKRAAEAKAAAEKAAKEKDASHPTPKDSKQSPSPPPAP